MSNKAEEILLVYPPFGLYLISKYRQVEKVEEGDRPPDKFLVDPGGSRGCLGGIFFTYPEYLFVFGVMQGGTVWGIYLFWPPEHVFVFCHQSKIC